MYRPFIAGITALSLTLASGTQVQAQGISDEDIGKLLFGLVSTVAVVAMVQGRDHNDRSEDAAEPPQPRTYLPKDWIGENRRIDLPRRCLRTVQLRHRDIRVFTRDCMSVHYPRTASLPRECLVGTRGRDNYGYQSLPQGWEVQCMRDNGYRIAGRR